MNKPEGIRHAHTRVAAEITRFALEKLTRDTRRILEDFLLNYSLKIHATFSLNPVDKTDQPNK